MERLLQLAKARRLPHAWIFAGEQEQGEKRARQLIATVLCQLENNDPCGQCQACILLASNIHPDFQAIAPVKQSITVDNIRAINQFVVVTPQLAEYKFVLILQAHMMNQHASNALLKMIEEPASNTVFFLIVPQRHLLSTTIISRCQCLRIGGCQAVERDIGYILLQGLCALWSTYQENPLKVAEKWLNYPEEAVLYWLWVIVAEIITCHLTQEVSYIADGSWQQNILSLAKAQCLQGKKAWQKLDAVDNIRKRHLLGQNPNFQLFLENFLQN